MQTKALWDLQKWVSVPKTPDLHKFVISHGHKLLFLLSRFRTTELQSVLESERAMRAFFYSSQKYYLDWKFPAQPVFLFYFQFKFTIKQLLSSR